MFEPEYVESPKDVEIERLRARVSELEELLRDITGMPTGTSLLRCFHRGYPCEINPCDICLACETFKRARAALTPKEPIDG